LGNLKLFSENRLAVCLLENVLKWRKVTKSDLGNIKSFYLPIVMTTNCVAVVSAGF